MPHLADAAHVRDEFHALSAGMCEPPRPMIATSSTSQSTVLPVHGPGREGDGSVGSGEGAGKLCEDGEVLGHGEQGFGGVVGVVEPDLEDWRGSGAGLPKSSGGTSARGTVCPLDEWLGWVSFVPVRPGRGAPVRFFG